MHIQHQCQHFVTSMYSYLYMYTRKYTHSFTPSGVCVWALHTRTLYVAHTFIFEKTMTINNIEWQQRTVLSAWLESNLSLTDDTIFITDGVASFFGCTVSAGFLFVFSFDVAIFSLADALARSFARWVVWSMGQRPWPVYTRTHTHMYRNWNNRHEI